MISRFTSDDPFSPPSTARRPSGAVAGKGSELRQVRSVWRSALLPLGFAPFAACSLHSLDYLHKDDADETPVGGAAGASLAGGAGAASVAGAGAVAAGGVESAGGAGGLGEAGGAAGSAGSLPDECSDKVRNGLESAVDCGGDECSACAIGKSCGSDADCESLNCVEGVCYQANCAVEPSGPGCEGLVDGAVYRLHPSHELTLCVGIGGALLSSGSSAVQASCDAGLANKFRAVEVNAGEFELRGAFTAKCLEVSGGASTPGTGVAQAACTGEDHQLWGSVLTSSGYHRLTAVHSALVLDVAGSSTTTPGALLDQQIYDGSADMEWQLEPTPPGSIEFSHAAAPGLVLVFQDDAVTFGETGQVDSAWIAVPGLADPECVSFESSATPGLFLRHFQFLLRADLVGSGLNTPDATFCVRSPLSGGAANLWSLESLNFPDNYLSYEEGSVPINVDDGTAAFAASATWTLSEPAGSSG